MNIQDYIYFTLRLNGNTLIIFDIRKPQQGKVLQSRYVI